MEEENTHIIFDGKRVVVSPNLQQVFFFLCGIGEEIDSIFGFDKKLESIKKQHLETIELIQVLSKNSKKIQLILVLLFQNILKPLPIS